jgi:hypothetical protein
MRAEKMHDLAPQAKETDRHKAQEECADIIEKEGAETSKVAQWIKNYNENKELYKNATKEQQKARELGIVFNNPVLHL